MVPRRRRVSGGALLWEFVRPTVMKIILNSNESRPVPSARSAPQQGSGPIYHFGGPGPAPPRPAAPDAAPNATRPGLCGPRDVHLGLILSFSAFIFALYCCSRQDYALRWCWVTRLLPPSPTTPDTPRGSSHARHQEEELSGALRWVSRCVASQGHMNTIFCRSPADQVTRSVLGCRCGASPPPG